MEKEENGEGGKWGRRNMEKEENGEGGKWRRRKMEKEENGEGGKWRRRKPRPHHQEEQMKKSAACLLLSESHHCLFLVFFSGFGFGFGFQHDSIRNYDQVCLVPRQRYRVVDLPFLVRGRRRVVSHGPKGWRRRQPRGENQEKERGNTETERES
jgi:hypothetical protein